jgi:hypothetical protein
LNELSGRNGAAGKHLSTVKDPLQDGKADSCHLDSSFAA